MHIVFVTSEFPTEKAKMGGLASYTNNIAHIFKEHNHDVTVITLSPTNDDRLIEKDGIVVERVRLKNLSMFKGTFGAIVRNVYNSFWINVRVQKVHKVHPIDIIQYGTCSYVALSLLNRRNIPSVVRLSSDIVLWHEMQKFDYNFRASINRMTFHDLCGYVGIKNADKIFGPSNVIAQILSKRIHRPVDVIESPFYLNKNDFDDSLYQKKLGGKTYILTHSTIARSKGVGTIAEIIYDVLQQHPNIYWVFAGNDAEIQLSETNRRSAVWYLKKCAKEHKDRVIHLCALPKSELYPVVEHASLCVLPSLMDNLPNTCIEAMALRRVVIGTYGASYEQLITHKKSGFLIHKNASLELKKTISHALSLSDTQREKMGEYAYERIQQQAPDCVYQRMMDFYSPLRLK